MPNYRFRILEWQDRSGHIHEGKPTEKDLEDADALKVQYVNVDDTDDVRVYIVRHPTSFKTLQRALFDIELTAQNSGGPMFTLVHE